jgi:hypothetical protein
LGFINKFSIINQNKYITMNDEVMMEQPMEERSMAKEYRPSRGESLREYQINMRFLSVGVVVSVGCKEIAFTTIKEAMEAVNKYVESPYEESKRWREIFENQN